MTLSRIVRDLVVFVGDHPVGEIRRMLGGRDFGGVQAGVDPHDRLAFARQRFALLRGVAWPSASRRLICLILIELGADFGDEMKATSIGLPLALLPNSSSLMRSLDCGELAKVAVNRFVSRRACSRRRRRGQDAPWASARRRKRKASSRTMEKTHDEEPPGQ